MNNHHSPLRARPSARGGDISARRGEASREVEKRDKSFKAKQLRSKRKQSRSKSKSKVPKSTRPLTAKTLAREFHTFKQQLEKPLAAVIPSERDRS